MKEVKNPNRLINTDDAGWACRNNNNLLNLVYLLGQGSRVERTDQLRQQVTGVMVVNMECSISYTHHATLCGRKQTARNTWL